MQITSVNGMRVYVPEAKDFNMEVKPSYLLIASQTWKEGAKRDSLSVDELNGLKRRYNFKDMSEKEAVDFMGELVEAGIMDTGTAKAMYLGLIPADASSKGVLTKCDPAMEARRDSLRKGFDGMGAGYEGMGGIRTMLSAGGIESYRNWYEYTKLMMTVDVEKSEHFQSGEMLLEIFEWMNQ